MAITKLEDLGDTIPTLMEEAMFTAQFKAIMRSQCWNIRKGKGTNVNVPYFGEVTASQLVEGIDMTASQTMVDTNVQIVPYEAGLKIILTDAVIEDDNEDLKRAAGVLVGDGYEKKREQDLLGQIDDATTSLAASADALTMGHIAAARATLLGNPTSAGGPAPTPFVCVIHPYHELDLVDVLSPLIPSVSSVVGGVGGSMADDVIRNYSIGRLFGIPIISDGNIAKTAEAAKGGVFSAGKRGGIIYVSAREPSIEAERDASLRAWEMNYVGRYGVGEYLAGWIVELFADAAVPT